MQIHKVHFCNAEITYPSIQLPNFMFNNPARDMRHQRKMIRVPLSHATPLPGFLNRLFLY